ncbi:hypothetical protein EC973_008053 [Apophysomyces ossiformis]|uniref:Protein kinase domain-containing protein n=1 Tax=Apophysomyces ossiformis TaxID=679940 RepID=A0A8H7BLJ3_9FUNG|nr:hypothetical protein EC973_008053 [Apophysomyces ossiformis]
MQDWNTYEGQKFFMNPNTHQNNISFEWKRDRTGYVDEARMDNPLPTTSDDLQDDFDQEIDRLLRESMTEYQQSYPSAVSLSLEQVDQLLYENMDELGQDYTSLSLANQEQVLEALLLDEPSFSDESSYSSDQHKHNPPIETGRNLFPEEALSTRHEDNNSGKEISTLKPRLHLHIPKQRNQHQGNTMVAPDAAQINLALYETSTKPKVDIKNLRRLTLAIFRTLHIPVEPDDIPTVDLHNPSSTDVHQSLPPAMLLLMTSMILGTSGDKPVADTFGSQISNGDLVALQRIITAMMNQKNIIMQPAATRTEELLTMRGLNLSRNNNSFACAKYRNGVYDLSNVQFNPPAAITPLFLRLYRFVLDTLFSTVDCWPFFGPAPSSDSNYREQMPSRLYLSTVEKNVWRGKYTNFAQFEQDIQLVWSSAVDCSQDMNSCTKDAERLEQLFYATVHLLKEPIRYQDWYAVEKYAFDPTQRLAEELDPTDISADELFINNRVVYLVPSIIMAEQKLSREHNYGNDELPIVQLNRPFFEAVEQMRGNSSNYFDPIPRLYVANNPTARGSPGALYAVLYNTRVTYNAEDRYLVDTDVVLAVQIHAIHDMKFLDERFRYSCLGGWAYLRPLRIMECIAFCVDESIKRECLDVHFAPFRISYPAKKEERNLNDRNKYLRKMIQAIFFIPDIHDDAEASVAATEPKVEVKKPTYLQVARDTQYEKEEIQSIEQETKPAVTIQFGINCVKIIEGAKMTPEIMHTVWQKLLNSKSFIDDSWISSPLMRFAECYSKGIGVHNISKRYKDINWEISHSDGFFKQVYFAGSVVVQTFRNMTLYQRVTEIACLMKLRNLPRMAQIKEVLYNDEGDIVGLSMDRYHVTLKDYGHLHSHHRLTAYQKYDIIHQMLMCLKTVHEAGIAHRDLSEVNFMINTIDGELEDQSSKTCLYLIDFGKSVFCNALDMREWFVEIAEGKERADHDDEDDLSPKSAEELQLWCANLPWIKGKPDHGYRMYRSIQTLPKTRTDTQTLPWLIHPQAEDMYSATVMIWKIFTETEPWRGILDSDIQGLRYVAEDDYRIQKAIEHEVQGELSRQLLLKCLRTQPQDRETAANVLEWITREDIRNGLITEWKIYSAETRASRRAKSLHGREDELKEKSKKRRKAAQQQPSTSSSRKTQVSGLGKNRNQQKPKSLE